MDAIKCYEEGRLQDAVEAAIKDVQAHPADSAKRSLLCEMLCFSGDLKRADKQLETVLLQDPSAGVGVNLWRALIRAETARRQFYEEGRLPEFLSEPDEADQAWLKANVHYRAGDFEIARNFLNEALERTQPLSGECDGSSFDDFRDWDELSAATFEVLTSSGKYYWIPMRQIRSIEFHPLDHLRDLIWRPARISVRSGTDGEVYFPTLYQHSHAHADSAVQLARVTDWEEANGFTRGVGVRMFMVGDHNKQILEIGKLAFAE